MTTITADPPTGTLPRKISDSLLLTGGVLGISYGGETVYGHMSTYLILGSEKTLMVDTGHPVHWKDVEKTVDSFLGGRQLDYIFPTHTEMPHAGLMHQLMEKYPGAKAVGDMRDWELYAPELSDRFIDVRPGDSVDLGDRKFVFVPAVWRDLPNTLWGFDTKERVLFVSDAFAYLHYHHPGESDLMTSEMPPPDLKMIQFFNERALQWTKFTDVESTFADLDALIDRLKPRMIAPGHGGIIDNQEQMTPVIKSGMSSAVPAAATPSAAAADAADAALGVTYKTSHK